MENKRNCSNIFWTKTFKFCPRIISFCHWSLKTSKCTSIGRVRQPWTRRVELWEQFAIFHATTGNTSLQTNCLYIRNGKLDTKVRSRQTKSRKENSRTAFEFFRLWMVISSPKQKFPARVSSSFLFVLSENVFCPGMVVLLNPVCVLLSGMLHVCSFRGFMSSKHWLLEAWIRFENSRVVWTYLHFWSCGKQGGRKHLKQLPISVVIGQHFKPCFGLGGLGA